MGNELIQGHGVAHGGMQGHVRGEPNGASGARPRPPYAPASMPYDGPSGRLDVLRVAQVGTKVGPE